MTSLTTQADKPLELARKVGILRPWDLDTYGIYHPEPVLTALPESWLNMDVHRRAIVLHIPAIKGHL